MVFSLQKEANFMAAVEEYRKKYGRDIFSEPLKPKSKKAIVPKAMELEDIRADVDDYTKRVSQSITKHRILYEKFKDVPNVEAIIYRYDVWGFLNNISLSVPPSIKRKWKINYELFGAFYNTNTPYNSLFHDLEPGSQGNVMYYTPQKEHIVLANPPYTESWIRWTCRQILDKWLNKATFYVVIPAWDCKTRDEKKLKSYNCVYDIADLIRNAKEYKLYERFPFWDGINQKEVNLKDVYIHVIKI
jgi:hypothetical protein